MGDQAAFISAGGYHHHIGLNTWESRGGSAAAARHDRALPLRDPLSRPRAARRRAAAARRGRDPAHGRVRPRRQRGALPERPGRERRRALPRPAARGVAARPGRRRRDGERPARPRSPARRGAGDAWGYMEGPAADEAERRLDELERGVEPRRPRSGSPSSARRPPTPRSTSSAGGTTSIPDELFASGEAWGLSVVRRPVEPRRRATARRGVQERDRGLRSPRTGSRPSSPPSSEIAASIVPFDLGEQQRPPPVAGRFLQLRRAAPRPGRPPPAAVGS